MRAWRLHRPSPVENHPLQLDDLPVPQPGAGQVLLRVHVCGVCHTDLHTVEGEITPPAYPITPGHQVVGRVAALGAGVTAWRVGQRVGVPWLYAACGECAFCRRGEENLCPQARFTGFHADGGYAEFMLADARYVLPLPDDLTDQLFTHLEAHHEKQIVLCHSHSGTVEHCFCGWGVHKVCAGGHGLYADGILHDFRLRGYWHIRQQFGIARRRAAGWGLCHHALPLHQCCEHGHWRLLLALPPAPAERGDHFQRFAPCGRLQPLRGDVDLFAFSSLE
ncbi:MAG: hypothetical protein Fur0018_01320 [Anaerolineales bacterium]